MPDARALLEALTLPIANSLEQLIQPGTDEGLTQWSALHGWNGTVKREVVARQAALNLMLRALICHCLEDYALPDVAPAYFILAQSNALLQSLGIVIQPSSYLDDLAMQAGVTIQKAGVTALASRLRCQQSDVIGEVYASWVSQDARRPLGQFWTPLPIAKLMTQWAVQSPSDRVLDPAFGSGIFLLTATDRLTCLGAPLVPDSQQVSGVELSPLAFLMGLTNVLLHYPDTQPLLQWGDFLVPEREPLVILKEPAATYDVRVQQMTLPGLEITAPTVFSEQFDAIVCNPPYTRHHHLPEAYKSSWAAVMKQEYGIRLSRFSSLFAYFFVQATRMLDPAGRMAFITPATVFEASYSRQVKAFIQRQLHLRAIITFDEALSIFEGVDTAACITLVEGPQTPVGERAVHVQIRRWPGVNSVLQAIEQGGTTTLDWGTSRAVDLSALEPKQKWTVIWYAMEQRDPAPIYFTYLSRKRSRFIYNQANVLALNVFLCIYPIPAIGRDETMLKALLATLNSLVAKDSLRHVGRTYGGDTIKIEPREMDRLPVLNPVKLTADERERLAGLFDQLCRADSEEAEKAIRQTIDEEIAAIAKVL